jgi:Baseplate J-like protein.
VAETTDTTDRAVADVLAVDEAVLRSTGPGAFGILPEGFAPKPFGRLLAEKLALARQLFGDDLDLTSGSALRKVMEVQALEDARLWAALAGMYDGQFVATATGAALSRLGEELGIPRPFLEARGQVRLSLAADLPAGVAQLTLPRGSRLLTEGGHHAALEETVTLTPAQRERTVAVSAFYPGPEHNLDPAQDGQALTRWNEDDEKLDDLRAVGFATVAIAHDAPLTGGELRWSDRRYRALLLQAPRSLWTVDAVRLAVSLVPGVRQVQVHDGWGGLDIGQSIFGNFNFIERLFSAERDLTSPYYFTVLVAPTPSAFWDGPDGLYAAVASALEDVRPVGILPRIQKARSVGIQVRADLVVQGLPLPVGDRATVNDSEAARALKRRLLLRLRPVIEEVAFGEPVRAAEVTWALMNEPGIADVRDLALVRYPSGSDALDFAGAAVPSGAETLACGANATLEADQIPVFADDDSGLTIV